jgi:glycine cleavage system transcriptional repressor
MSEFVVLTAVGRDRPGIVAGVAETLWKAGCNIEETSMTLLRSEFAMIVIARRPPELSTAALGSRLVALEESLGLQISLKELSAEESQEPGARSQERSYVVHVYGADRTGIVYRIAALLAARGINITDVETRVLPAGEGSRELVTPVTTATPVYVMLLEIDLPLSVTEEALQRALDEAAAELGVDVTLRAVDAEAL